VELYPVWSLARTVLNREQVRIQRLVVGEDQVFVGVNVKHILKPRFTSKLDRLSHVLRLLAVLSSDRDAIGACRRHLWRTLSGKVVEKQDVRPALSDVIEEPLCAVGFVFHVGRQQKRASLRASITVGHLHASDKIGQNFFFLL